MVGVLRGPPPQRTQDLRDVRVASDQGDAHAVSPQRLDRVEEPRLQGRGAGLAGADVEEERSAHRLARASRRRTPRLTRPATARARWRC